MECFPYLCYVNGNVSMWQQFDHNFKITVMSIRRCLSSQSLKKCRACEVRSTQSFRSTKCRLRTTFNSLNIICKVEELYMKQSSDFIMLFYSSFIYPFFQFSQIDRLMKIRSNKNFIRYRIGNPSHSHIRLTVCEKHAVSEKSECSIDRVGIIFQFQTHMLSETNTMLQWPLLSKKQRFSSNLEQLLARHSQDSCYIKMTRKWLLLVVPASFSNVDLQTKHFSENYDLRKW